MHYTRAERNIMRKVEHGIITLTEAARLLSTPDQKKNRQNVAYRFWNIHVQQVRKARR